MPSAAGGVTIVRDGVYRIKYTLRKASQLYNMVIEVQAGGSGPFNAIRGSPFPIICQVSKTAPANTVISGSGAETTTAGKLTDFTVTLFDIGGNQRTSGGDQLIVSIDSSSASPPPAGPHAHLKRPIKFEIFDLLDGTYTVRYVIDDATWPGECGPSLSTCK